MKKFQKLFALTAVMTMLASPAYSQECGYNQGYSQGPEVVQDYNQDGGYYQGGGYNDDGCCYDDCESASCMSACIPIGALIVAGILIATTHHHHSSSSHFHSH